MFKSTRDDKLIATLVRTYGESGLSGIARRAAGRVLESTSDVFEELSGELQRITARIGYREANARLTGEQKALLEESLSLKNCLRGERAFVVATGPSIRDQDLSPLIDETIIGVNGLWKHPMSTELDIDYFVVMDKHLFDPEWGADEFYAGLFERCSPKKVFVPLRYREQIERHNWIPRERRQYYYNFLQFWHAHVDWADILDEVSLCRAFPCSATVLHIAIICGLHMGASELYLLGADHSWLASPTKATHFYKDSLLSRENPESNYRSDYLQRMKYTRRVFEGAKAIETLARRQKAEIINSTPGSFLDIHRRVAFDSLFQ